MKQSKFLSLKEFVIVLLLACVETAIGLVVTIPFAANLQLVYFLAPGLAGLINGIIYVLIIKKCPHSLLSRPSMGCTSCFPEAYMSLSSL